MGNTRKSMLSRLLSGIVGLLPDGGIGADGPPPDVDGRRDTDSDYKRALFTAKTQVPPHGSAMTSYEPVERVSKEG